MVLAYHVIIAAYGFWLPNDERGSWSDFVRRWELLRFGPATKTDSRHSYLIEQVTNRLKGAATRELMSRGAHPLAGYFTKCGGTPSPWAEGLWKVYLDSSADIERAVDYVERNPEKENKKRQNWKFVTPLDIWRYM